MAKLRKDAWKDCGWERGEQIPGGNQGHAFAARRVSDPPQVYDYILKTLKHQEKTDRRAMFAGEVLAMGVLDHPGIAKVEGTNAERFREPEELFLVTRRISGFDLDTLVTSNKMALDDALRATIAVLRVLNHCHARGVCHRDIKPCHVIFRDKVLTDPVLIDFGLAFHAETQPTEAETLIGQGKGNRFLIGPEHHPDHPALNRNPATDISQVVGLFFFALTQKAPGLLRDSTNKKPHERLAGSLLPADAPQWKDNLLQEVFDIGFEWEPSRRWQSIERLVAKLESLGSDTERVDADFESSFSAMMLRAVTSSHTSRLVDAIKMRDRLFKIVQDFVRIAQSQSQALLNVTCQCSDAVHEKQIGSAIIGMSNKVNPGKSRAISFTIEFVDDGYVHLYLRPHSGDLAIFPKNSPIRLGSYDLGSAECCDSVKPFLATKFSECIREILGVDSNTG